MSYREAMELARIRHELRERLMMEHREGVDELLERLHLAAENDTGLRCEYERWRLRFDLLSVSGVAA